VNLDNYREDQGAGAEPTPSPPSPRSDTDLDVMHRDLQELLVALGLRSGARPESPHQVMQEAIAEVRRRSADSHEQLERERELQKWIREQKERAENAEAEVERLRNVNSLMVSEHDDDLDGLGGRLEKAETERDRQREGFEEAVKALRKAEVERDRYRENMAQLRIQHKEELRDLFAGLKAVVDAARFLCFEHKEVWDAIRALDQQEETP
jgi:hypothetical protein